MRSTGEVSQGRLSREYVFALGLLYTWRAAFLEGGQQGLKGEGGQQGLKGKVASPSAALEAENERLKSLLAEKELMLDHQGLIKRGLC